MGAKGGIMSELLTCPFCGGEASIGRRDYFFEDSNEYAMSAHYVECGTCYVRTIEYKSKDGAADAWNRRAERTCCMEYNEEWSGDELYPTECYNCSECGHMTYDGVPTFCPNCGARVVEEVRDDADR